MRRTVLIVKIRLVIDKKNRFLFLTCIIILILILLMLTGVWIYNEYQYSRKEGALRFYYLTQESEDALRHRLFSYEQVLLGAAGFIVGSDRVTFREWRAYVSALNLANYFPGMRSLGFIVPIKKENLNAFEKEQRREVDPNFTVHPITPRDDYFVVKYVEPFDKIRKSIGLNIAFENNRYRAALLAQKSYKSVITKHIMLIYDVYKQPAFLLLHPVYKDINNKEHFEGWTFAPCVANDFLKHLTGNEKNYNLRIYEGDKIEAHGLIYSNATAPNPVKPLFVIHKKIRLMQQDWLLVWTSSAFFDHVVSGSKPLYIGFICFSFIMLLSILFYFLWNRSEVISRMVDQKTKEISANEERLKLLIKYTPASVAMFDKEMKYILASDRWIQDYDLKESNIIGKSHYAVFPEILGVPRWLEIHQRALAGEMLSMSEDSWERDKNHREWVKWAIHPWKNAHGEIGGIVMFTEVITQKKEIEIREQVLREIAQESTSSNSIDEVMQHIVDIICRNFNWSLGHVFHYDTEAGMLRSSNIWYFANNQLKYIRFRQLSEKMEFRPGQGLPGKVYSERKILFINDVAVDKEFIRSKLIHDLDLHNAIGIPVIINNQVFCSIRVF